LPTLIKSTVGLNESTIGQLKDSSIEKNESSLKLTKDLSANESLNEIKNFLKVIKEQNDEIIGEVF